MDVSALKYFIVAAQTEHMSRAAEKLNITQPSLSASIKRLEADIGFQLFDRTGRGIRLNEYGRIFFDAVLRADAIMETCMAEMEEKRKASDSFIRLACSGSEANSRLIDLLLSQGVNLKVENIPQDWEKELLERRCDLVITMGKWHHTQLSNTCLRYQKMAFVVGKGHPLASSASVSPEELCRHPFCSTDAPYSLLNVLKDQLPEYDFRPPITFLGRSSADMLKAIRSGRYVGLMVQRNLPADETLTLLSVDGFDISLPIYLYWREADTARASLTAVRDSIVAFYRAMPAEPAG
jgi:DNA-binding transcriptional LysR family regulator